MSALDIPELGMICGNPVHSQGTGLIMLYPCSHVVCLWCTAHKLRETHQCPICKQKAASCWVHDALYRRFMVDTTVTILEEEEDGPRPLPAEAGSTRISPKKIPRPSTRYSRYQRRSYAKFRRETVIL